LVKAIKQTRLSNKLCFQQTTRNDTIYVYFLFLRLLLLEFET